MARVYYGKGDQLVHIVPHRDGRPVRVVSATYMIWDPRHGESSVLVPAGTAATIDPASTTLSSMAGRRSSDHRVLAVGSSAGLVPGHSYLLESPKGVAELVRIVSVPDATHALAAAEIRGDFPAQSTLRGIEVTASFPGSAADDDKNLDGWPWGIVWTFDGFPPIRDSIFLERGEEQQLATLDDLRELDPYISKVGGDRIEPALALARAHKDWRTDVSLAGASESDFLSGPIGRDAVTYRAAELALQHSDDESSQRRAEYYGKRYQELRAAIQVGAKKPGVVTLDKSDASAEAANPAQLFRMFGY